MCIDQEPYHVNYYNNHLFIYNSILSSSHFFTLISYYQWFVVAATSDSWMIELSTSISLERLYIANLAIKIKNLHATLVIMTKFLLYEISIIISFNCKGKWTKYKSKLDLEIWWWAWYLYVKNISLYFLFQWIYSARSKYKLFN